MSFSEDANKILKAAPHWVGVTDQKNDRLAIYDLAVADWTDPAAVVWEYIDPQHIDYPGGIKFRHTERWGDVLLYCGRMHAGILRISTKEMVFYTQDIPLNPHTVELLPNGTFLVGGTQQWSVYAYDAFGTSDRHTYEIKSDVDVHGLLWDPEYRVLWISGQHFIQPYQLSGSATDLTAVRISDRTIDTGSLGIHDLSAVYGNKDKLWITMNSGVLQAHKKTLTVDRDYIGAEVIGHNPYTPGMGNFPDGVLAWTVPNNTLQDWDTDELYVYVPYGDGKAEKITYHHPDCAWYKCRVFCTDYQ